MGNFLEEKQLIIAGMTCMSCQNKIEETLKNTVGVSSVTVSYADGKADIVYAGDQVSLRDIEEIIEKLNYSVVSEKKSKLSGGKRTAGFLIIIAALFLLLQQFGILNLMAPNRLAEASMGYGMLFVIGLLTSVHCVAMCGGINISQCMPREAETEEKNGIFSTIKPTLLYNLGRVISYTVVGFVVGALGSTITFSNVFQGVLKFIAGGFMIIMGVNMLGIFPWLRKINPRLPAFLTSKIKRKKSGNRSPLIVGLLNGLMPCGPLQAMQIYALSTGNPLTGAIAMFLFSLGTVPLMFGLGATSSALGRKFTKKMMSAGAVLVVVLGLSMFFQGWSLSGWKLHPLLAGQSPFNASTDESDFKIEEGAQIIKSTLSSGRYPAITVKAGLPVKWIIDAPKGSINGCNNRIFIPEYQIEYTFKIGENVIEFTPDKTGSFVFSCWMGMIRSTIKVVDQGSDNKVGNNPIEEEGFFEDDSPNASREPAEPIPAGYVIPTDKVAVAELADDYQLVTIALTDEGFSPAVMVVERNIETRWIINNASSKDSNKTLNVAYYLTQLALEASENSLYFFPDEDFDFYNGDGTFFGYVKVVENIDDINIEKIKKEVSNFKTTTLPPEAYQTGDPQN